MERFCERTKFWKTTEMFLKLFYWTNDFAKQIEIKFLNHWKNKQNGSCTNDELTKWKKLNTPISSPISGYIIY